MVYFLTNIKLPNYILDDTAYKYTHTVSDYGRGVALELLEINYAYWILFNRGVKNIELTTTCNNITEQDTVVFYNCSNNIALKKLEFSKKYKKIQIVTDRPIINGCDGYICYDQSIVSRDPHRKWFHVMYPMPIGLKKCKPIWPPENITCIAPDGVTIPRELFKDKQFNIITDSYVNTGDEHILFHLRKSITFNESRGIHTRMKFPSHKTANRLYQAWYCNVPGIFSSNDAMEHICRSDMDYLKAENIKQLYDQVHKLKTDEQLYYNMVDNCISRENENNHDEITRQWLNVITYYGNN